MMVKKLLSLMLCFLMVFTCINVTVASANETFSIVSAEKNGCDLTVKFSGNIVDTEHIRIMDVSTGQDITGVTKSASVDTVTVTLPSTLASSATKQYYLIIDGQTESVSGTTLGQTKAYSFTHVYYTSNDYKYFSADGSSTLLTQNLKTTVFENGWAVFGQARGTSKGRTTSVPTDFENLKIGPNQTLTFDYKTDDLFKTPQNNSNESGSALIFLASELGTPKDTSVTNNQWYTSAKCYEFCMGCYGNYMLMRFTNSENTVADNQTANLCYGLQYQNPTKNNNPSFVGAGIKGTSYLRTDVTDVITYKVVTSKVDTGLNIKISAKNKTKDTDWVSLFDYTDTDPVNETGYWGFYGSEAGANDYFSNAVISQDSPLQEVKSTFKLLSAEKATDNRIKLTFSEIVGATSLSNIKATFGSETFSMNTVVDSEDSKIVYASLPDAYKYKTGTYSISIGAGVSSALGFGLDKPANYEFTRNGLAEDFSASYDPKTWRMFNNNTNNHFNALSYDSPVSSTTGYNATVEDGKLVDVYTQESPIEENGKIINAGSDCLIAPIPTSEYNLSGNTTFEYDYSKTYDSTSKSATFAFFRAEDLYSVASPSWQVYAKNSYAIKIFQYASDVSYQVPHLQLIKYGETAATINGQAALKSVADTSIFPDTTNTKYRFKVKTTDIKDSTGAITSVNISVSFATYGADGNLSDYQEVITHTDSDNPLTSGYIGFGAYRSSGRFEYDNVVYENEPTLTYVKDNDDTLKDWAESRKAETGKSSLDFVTLGGSITQGGVWPQIVTDYLNTTTGVNFNHFNAGVGGTGSEYAMARLDTDVISKNPDLVFVEYAVNDASLRNSYINSLGYVNRSVFNMESIIRRLEALENPPMIVIVDFTTLSLLKEDLVNDKTTHTAKYYEDDYTLIKDKHNYLAEYYGIPVIDIHDYFKSFCSLDADDNLVVNYDDSKISKYLPSTVTGTGDGTAILSDRTHPNLYGKNFYGDYMVSCLKSDVTTKFKDLVKPEKTFVTPVSIPSENFKDIELTPEEVTGSARFTVIGNPEIVANNNTNRAAKGKQDVESQEEIGVLISAGSQPATITYDFYGDSFIAYAGTQTYDYRPNTEVTIDGSNYSLGTVYTPYRNKSMQGNGKHTFSMKIPAGKTVTLYRISTDETSNVMRTVKDKDGKNVVLMDLSQQACARGVADSSETLINPWDGKVDHVNKTWVELMNYTSTADFMDYYYVDKTSLMSNLDEPTNSVSFTGTNTRYDASMFGNARQRAISAGSQSSIYVGPIQAQKVKVLCAIGNKDSDRKGLTEFPVTLKYSDGTEEIKTVDFSDGVSDDGTLIADAGFVNGRSWLSSSVIANNILLQEMTLSPNPAKTLVTIQFSSDKIGNYDRLNIFGISFYMPEKSLASEYKTELKNSDNMVKNQLNAGETMTCEYDLLNATTDNITTKPILAIYDEDGNLYKVSLGEGTLNSAVRNKLNFAFEVPSQLPEGYTYKVMLWKGLDNLLPIIK